MEPRPGAELLPEQPAEILEDAERLQGELAEMTRRRARQYRRAEVHDWAWRDLRHAFRGLRRDPLFTIGVIGVLTRRNAIIVFMCIELMLNAVNLAFVVFSRQAGIEGQVFVFFVMTVAAAEAAVGLAIVIGLFRHRESLNPEAFTSLKW